MKLVYRLALRTLLVMLPIMALWGFFFYRAMIAEVVDETDNMLDDYSKTIIRRVLGGERLPSISNSSYNQFYLRPIPASEAAAMPAISYADSMVYIIDRGKKEPSRIVRTVFVNDAGQHFLLTVAAPTLDKQDVIRKIFYWIVILYVVLLLTVVVVNTIVFYRSLRPLYILLDWLDNYSVGRGNAPLSNPTSIVEFRKLNDAAVKNAARHEIYHAQQKAFISNASHEVQTPVAICLNRVEMLMNDTALHQGAVESLSEIHSTLMHISRMNRSLLLLTRIDNGQFSDVSRVDLERLARSYVGNMAEIYSYKGMSLHVEGQGGAFFEINPTLAEMLVSNLIKNAFIHSPDGGEVSLAFGEGMLRISNTAAAGPLDAENIFERFYQGSKKEGSTGLGLAIASSICKEFGIGLSYSYSEGMHVFTVKAK